MTALPWQMAETRKDSPHNDKSFVRRPKNPESSVRAKTALAPGSSLGLVHLYTTKGERSTEKKKKNDFITKAFIVETFVNNFIFESSRAQP